LRTEKEAEMKLGMMWAGITDGHIATGSDSTDQYAPLTIALFGTKNEAERYYEHVIRIDVDAMLRIEKQKAR